jgi:aminoglycoside 3-N-acetyltransferase
LNYFNQNAGLFLNSIWAYGGINLSDTLLLHSDLKSIFRFAFKNKLSISPGDILDSIINYLGPNGTLILPLFNFDFARGSTFNMLTSKSQMGILSEIGRAHTEIVRTGHPIYSFGVIGKLSSDFVGLENYSGYGIDSPFGILHRLEGKIAILNLPDQHSMTFYHYIEECCNVDYRYHKNFSGKYIDSNGIESVKTFGLFVRDLNRGIKTDVNRMGELLWQLELYKGSRYGQDFGIRSALASDVYREVKKIIEAGKAENFLFKIEP